MDDTTTRSETSVSLEQAKTAVQEFQVRRLKRDFHDMRRSAEYGPFSEFFATEIYSARDFTERNESFRRVTNQFRNVIGEEIYVGLVRLLDLHTLTDRLDADVAAALIRMGRPVDFSEEEYEQVYRDLDNYEERLLQIDLIIESLEFTHRVSQMTLIGVVLKSAKIAAGLFTKDRIVELLERAYSMLRHIRDISGLTDEIRKREVERLDRIYDR